jgi:hypothetical protein
MKSNFLAIPQLHIILLHDRADINLSLLYYQPHHTLQKYLMLILTIFNFLAQIFIIPSREIPSR